MDVTTVLREQPAGIRRALVRAALPGRVLAVEVSLARELAPTRPHPRINGELGNKLTTPVLGPADRIRDFSARLRDIRRP
jgi:hypothetical protein